MKAKILKYNTSKECSDIFSILLVTISFLTVIAEMPMQQKIRQIKDENESIVLPKKSFMLEQQKWKISNKCDVVKVDRI